VRSLPQTLTTSNDFQTVDQLKSKKKKKKKKVTLQESAHYDFPVLTEYRWTELLIYEIMKL